MFLLIDNHPLFTCFKNEQRYQIIPHKLCSYRLADELRKFCCA